jgi:hypothetical protein
MSISPGLEAMITQLLPVLQRLKMSIDPILNQPIIRQPYVLPLADGQVIAAGASGQILNSTSFSYNFEWPFEVHAVKFSQDIAHTYRDWRVSFQDQTFQQPLQKNASLVADLVDDNTGKWEWKFPWVIRPKGGGMNVTVDNLDAVNPITVDLAFIGYQLIPKQGMPT